MSTVHPCTDPEDRRLALAVAVAALRRGELVVLPTDTVYGVGADAFQPAAVDCLLVAKGRGRDMPVPVLVASELMLSGVVDALPAAGRDLVAAFWPGGLTLIVRHTVQLAWDLGETRGTVAVRMPDHPVALELIQATGPLAVSSANRSGLAPATVVGEARSMLGDAVAVYLDAGPAAAAVPSTIVDLTGPVPVLVRQGAIDAELLASIVPEIESRP